MAIAKRRSTRKKHRVRTLAAFYFDAYKRATGNRSATAWNDTFWHFTDNGVPEQKVLDALYKARETLGKKEGWKGSWWKRRRGLDSNKVNEARPIILQYKKGGS